MDRNYRFSSSFYWFAHAAPSRRIGQSRESAAAAAAAATQLAISKR